MNRFNPRKHPLYESLQRDEFEIVERCQSGLERELLDQMRIISVDNPEEGVLKRGMILTKDIVNLVDAGAGSGVAVGSG